MILFFGHGRDAVESESDERGMGNDGWATLISERLRERAKGVSDKVAPRGSAPTGKEKEEEQSGLARWKSSIGPRRARIRPKVSISFFFFSLLFLFSFLISISHQTNF